MFSLFALPIRAVFILITLTTTVSVSVLALRPGDKPLFDPFAPYADILLGQPIETLLQRGFSCQFNPPPTLDETCFLIPTDGVFSGIQAEITPDTGLIGKVVFSPNDRMLSYGNLSLLWGRPEIAIYGQTANLRWRNRHIVAVLQTYERQFPFWSPISYVAFEIAH